MSKLQCKARATGEIERRDGGYSSSSPSTVHDAPHDFGMPHVFLFAQRSALFSKLADKI